MPDSDIALAKKRLASDVMIIVGVQVVASCVAIPCFLAWEHDFFVFALIVMLISFVAAMYGCAKLYDSKIMPFWIRVYGIGIFLFPPLGLVMIQFDFLAEHFFYLFVILWYGYGLIPQFFISRWLAKAAEEESSATDDTDNHG
jgi:hypothetical protein